MTTRKFEAGDIIQDLRGDTAVVLEVHEAYRTLAVRNTDAYEFSAETISFGDVDIHWKPDVQKKARESNAF